LYSFGRNSPYPLLEINPNIKPMSTKEYFIQYEQRYQSGKLAVHYRHIDASDEIAYQYSCGSVGGVLASCNSNLYDTKRSVLSVNADTKITPSALLRGSVDFVDATISSGSNAGNKIPLTPTQVIRGTYEQKIQNYVMTASAHYRTGMIQASDQSASYAQIPSRTVVDFGVRTQFSQKVSGSFWIRNAFNKSYYDYANSDGIYPADGRAVFANLKVGF
jgi:outer membrane receptor protein involved in Fe transport